MKLIQPSVVQDIVRKYDFRFKKKLGQNFLIDGNILTKIVNAAELTADDVVLEIGPGIGTMTQLLAESCERVVAVEKDDRLLPILNDTLAGYSNIVVESGDILSVSLRDRFTDWFGDRKANVVANLPYYVTTPIVMKLLEERLPLRHIVVMVQREVAERMTAIPGGPEYGSLSVAVQYYTGAKLICVVPGTAFVPAPAVSSAVIRLTLREHPPVNVRDDVFFFHVVRSCFAHRRKTILNNLLAAGLGEDRLGILKATDQAGIDPTRRAQTLSIEEFGRLCEVLDPWS